VKIGAAVAERANRLGDLEERRPHTLKEQLLAACLHQRLG
jgi:hypothetical protein